MNSPAQRRKQDSRERLLAAAADKFSSNGYFTTSVEDIAAAAGVSRMTFYRHYSDKADLAVELFNREFEETKARYFRIAEDDFRDVSVVRAWITDVFEKDRARRGLMAVFSQARADQPGFASKAQHMIEDLIAGLGEGIPAFRMKRSTTAGRRRWLQAWLLLYEILDQSNHAALESGVATDPLIPDILAERFVSFVNQNS